MDMSTIFKNTKLQAENDQAIPNTDITTWVDQAIDRINMALQCNIPKTSGQATTYVPAFDERYHESLVLFAVAKYRESDSDYNSANYFMGQFDQMLMTMQRDMKILPSTRVDFNVQQIVITDITDMIYTLDIPFGSYFDNINVYKNDVIVDSKYYGLSVENKTITFKGLTLVLNDKITIVFENNSDLNAPPYHWWSF